MSEQDQRQIVVKVLNKAGLHAISVENSCHPGTPDIDFAHGSIETKWLREWPKKEQTVVRIDHWTPQQKVFHMRRWAAGENCWVLLQVKTEWLLMSGEFAAQYLGHRNRAFLSTRCSRWWLSRIEMEEGIVDAVE